MALLMYLYEIVAAIGAETCRAEEGETWFVFGAKKGATPGEWNSTKRDWKTNKGTKVCLVSFFACFMLLICSMQVLNTVSQCDWQYVI